MQAFEQRMTDHLDKAVTASVSKLTVRVEKLENESNQTNAMLHMMRREHQSLVESHTGRDSFHERQSYLRRCPRSGQ